MALGEVWLLNSIKWHACIDETNKIQMGINQEKKSTNEIYMGILVQKTV